MAIVGLSSADMDDDGRKVSEEENLTEFQEELLQSLRTASLDGMKALSEKFKALCQKHTNKTENKSLSEVWISNRKTLEDAAKVVDRDANRG